MKKLLLAISFIVSFAISSRANHITGGEMFYTYSGRSGNDFVYLVTLKLFRDCNSAGAQLDDFAPIAVFQKGTNSMVQNFLVPRGQTTTLVLGSPDPCILNPPAVCYNVGFYTFEVTLPASPNGYTITYQRCCRIAGINNISPPSSNTGATYSAEIPGTSLLANGPENNSARFLGRDTVVVCANNYFTYSFAAFDDDDTDTLSYSFCNAFTGGGQTNGSGCPTCPNPNPPVSPPYLPINYAGQFSSSSPMGTSVTLNPATGLISGVAPAAGIYVVTVCVTEKRNGIVIATQRKDLQIKVGDCTIAKATLEPTYITCDGFTMNFSNLSNSPLIKSFFWDFGVQTRTDDTSNIATPTFTFPDTGIYRIKLVTNRRESCSDSTTALVKVYPGFFPAFNSTGICINKPTSFFDATITAYGVVDSWSWSFGDGSTLADTSHIKNPTWTYDATGPKTVVLTVTNSKGCIDTAVRVIDILDKPPINLAFRDTLICVPDALQLNASGSGVFNWGPNVNIRNENTATPTVNPTTTTVYNVTLNDQGCINNDSVRVRVIRTVTLVTMNDTTICRTDPITLSASTDALQYNWTPAGSLNNPNIANPIATPLTNTTYTLTGRVGSCSSSDTVRIDVVPYPVANAGPDQQICYQTSTQLNGSTDGSSFNWSPGATLSSTTILNPIASPKYTADYVLTAYDNLGCPKPGKDTVTVVVLPQMHPFAGRDTMVVVGEPLQFHAGGGVDYLWAPPTGLSSTTISNPVGNYSGEFDSIRYTVYVRNQADCLDSATVLVKIFKTSAYVFVPSAFTPNGDGLNDIIAPIAVGIQKIEYFRIFNRWGQMVFSTTANGHGWDGRIGGTPQATNTFVWICSAIDYTGKKLFLKGKVTLIR